MENFQDKLTETYVLYVVDGEPIDTTDLVSALSGGNLGIEWIDKHFTLIDYNENEILFKTEIFNELLFYLNDMIEQFLFDDGSFYDFSYPVVYKNSSREEILDEYYEKYPDYYIELMEFFDERLEDFSKLQIAKMVARGNFNPDEFFMVENNKIFTLDSVELERIQLRHFKKALELIKNKEL